ncbi:MAG: hypothetical protein ACKVU4_07710 [Phycisphaerales bacterium]
MTFRVAVLWTVAIGMSLAALAWFGRGASLARANAHAARATLNSTTEVSREVMRLRATVPGESAAPVPPSELPTHVIETLARCGLPAGAMASFNAPTASRETRGGPLRHRATLVLGSITLPQLGRFLGAWREARPDWFVSAIDLTPRNDRSAKERSRGGDLPLQAVLSLEVAALDPGGSP